MAGDKEQILAVYEQMQQAMVDKDTDTLREVMGADTTVRHISGEMVSRSLLYREL